jgi:hypothetical protein
MSRLCTRTIAVKFIFSITPQDWGLYGTAAENKAACRSLAACAKRLANTGTKPEDFRRQIYAKMLTYHSIGGFGHQARWFLNDLCYGTHGVSGSCIYEIEGLSVVARKKRTRRTRNAVL